MPKERWNHGSWGGIHLHARFQKGGIKKKKKVVSHQCCFSVTSPLITLPDLPFTSVKATMFQSARKSAYLTFCAKQLAFR